MEKERRNRIRLMVAAYAYEVLNDSVMGDAEYDALSRSIDLTVDTGSPENDAFFRSHFSPDTGMWIRRYPHLDQLHKLYALHYC